MESYTKLRVYFFKTQIHLNREFLKAFIQMAYKAQERCYTLLAIREMQIKTIMR
jgi:hypothetical protein